MGLTVHYTLNLKHDDPEQVKQTVHKMRQLALDLPFEQVGDIIDLQGEQCNTEARRAELQNGDEKNESLFWLLIQAGVYVRCPWNKYSSRTVNPTRILAFDTWPGPGCEAANFGLCLYPAEIEWEYKVEDDQRFQSAPKTGLGWREFDWDKWLRHCRRNNTSTHSPAAFTELRMVPTKLSGWHWSSFCKTQYASGGGIPNFLRCHISLITLLDRMKKLPGLKVKVDDEGRYGNSRNHKGLYNPAALVKEVGDWNEFVAAGTGTLSDALSSSEVTLEAPIKDFPNFEQLEFRGHQQKHLAPFLAAMKKLAEHYQPA